jgi:hypothetical protein
VCVARANADGARSNDAAWVKQHVACKYNKAGTCQLGAQCRFSHDPAVSDRSSARQQRAAFFWCGARARNFARAARVARRLSTPDNRIDRLRLSSIVVLSSQSLSMQLDIGFSVAQRRRARMQLPASAAASCRAQPAPQFSLHHVAAWRDRSPLHCIIIATRRCCVLSLRLLSASSDARRIRRLSHVANQRIVALSLSRN